MFIKYKINKTLGITLLFLILACAGYIIGSSIGSYLISGFLYNRNRIAFLLYRPAKQYFDVLRMINSNNELIRLSGYYSLLDNKIIDVKFLSERYFIENSLYIKRTIVWILGQSDDYTKVMDIYKKIYKEGNKSIRKDILEFLKGWKGKYYSDFIKSVK